MLPDISGVAFPSGYSERQAPTTEAASEAHDAQCDTGSFLCRGERIRQANSSIRLAQNRLWGAGSSTSSDEVQSIEAGAPLDGKEDGDGRSSPRRTVVAVLGTAASGSQNSGGGRL